MTLEQENKILKDIIKVLQGKASEPEEIEKIRKMYTIPGKQGSILNDFQILLSHIAFLEQMIGEIKEETSGYNRGLKDGKQIIIEKVKYYEESFEETDMFAELLIDIEN